MLGPDMPVPVLTSVMYERQQRKSPINDRDLFLFNLTYSIKSIVNIAIPTVMNTNKGEPAIISQTVRLGYDRALSVTI